MYNQLLKQIIKKIKKDYYLWMNKIFNQLVGDFLLNFFNKKYYVLLFYF